MTSAAASAAELVGEFDYVIVGAGTAGCVLANRLSQDASKRVLLLEAGGKDDWIWFKVPVGYLYCMGDPRADWGFKTEAEPGLNGRSLGYPRGRVLGGCSSINGMLYLRGQSADYDHWRQLGNPGWGWDDVLPYFKKSEDHGPGADDMHGVGGEWRVEVQRLKWQVLEAFKAAAVAAGLPETDDFNRGDNEGVGYFKVNQKGGWRWSAATGFLKPAMKRPNLTVMTHAQAERLVFDGARCAGIDFRHGTGTDAVLKRAAARGEVILASGAIGSPHLLQLSGVGPGDLLQEHGIETRVEAPGVGANLQDHLQIRCAYKVTGVPTLNTMSATLLGKAKIAMEYALKRSGPMSMAPSQLAAFARSGPDVATADLEYHVQPLTLEAFGQPLHPFDAFTASVCHLRPESRGTVRLKSPDPRAHPAIAPNYLSTEGDRRVAAAAIRLTRSIVAQAPLAKYRPEEFKPGPQYQTDAELAEAAGHVASTIFHPVGTCRMGPDAASVVDPELRVRGVEGLRVVDASIMPTITSGNTNSPTVMIAEKAADMIKAAARAGARAA
ncbi:GMC family oxidoreductase N-terminal domain-containing protein [Albimonas sp. CAU 1670]|uniref:GMC family oxidoreductase n=1 Tax=Albimonas sp. CAU 1670 TaxID=3032599 RepID=UPI0023DB2C76|nr:GMC family oxidoreductase N-terminal domain-containing protein [Albimonas sp. CAU 1670]MDF2235786.1 GMC family oxidoreductase N-terminal domain-containing protein [Albimonas sp. CAU 1670]